jgi:methionyl-tRNA formyltransferase
MNKKSIVFMGTPVFAVECLKKLIEQKFNILGVITSTDKQRGRGRKISFSPVKEYALSKNIKIFQPPNLKSEEFINKIKKLNADLFVVVAFRMLPKILIDLPKEGSINLHASLLPNYRGAAPINWVIINGENNTGVTTFFINEKIDEGNIIDTKKITISENETAGSLHDKLIISGSKLLIESIKKIFTKKIKVTQQKVGSNDKKAPKITKEFCQINLELKSTQLIRFIRGLSPYPGARIFQNNKIIKILNANSSKNIKGEKRKIFHFKNKLILNNNFEESIEITEIQVEGKKKMLTKDFIKGNTL